MKRLLCAMCAVLGCGGAQARPVAVTEATPGPETHEIAHEEPATSLCGSTGGMTLEGQLGTLGQNNVNRVLRAATDDLARCYHQRLDALPFLAGHIELKFRVATDGTVHWVLPTASTLGDREAERCMMDRARALHFDAPCGGEAEVTLPLDVEGGPDNRPATPWPAARLDGVVRAHRAALARCRAGVAAPISLTVYAGMDGHVATAGASVPTEDALAPVECILHEVSSWRLPTPGSWYARTTIQLP